VHFVGFTTEKLPDLYIYIYEYTFDLLLSWIQFHVPTIYLLTHCGAKLKQWP